MLDIIEVSADFLCTAMCVSNHGMLNILQSNISVWNRAVYISKLSVLKMNETDQRILYQVYRFGTSLSRPHLQ